MPQAQAQEVPQAAALQLVARMSRLACNGRRPRLRRGRRPSERGPLARLADRARALLAPGSEEGGVVAHAPPVPIREIFRRFWPDARPFRGWIAFGVLLLVLVPAVATAEIWMFKIVIDDVIVPGELAALVPIGLAYLGLTLAGGLLSFGDEYVTTMVGERFLLRLRSRLYAHVQGLSMDQLDSRRLGDLVSRITSDIQAIESFVLTGISMALSSVARIIFFAGALFVLDWRLALISLIVAPAFWLAARTFTRLIKRASREKRRRSGSLSAIAEEGLANAALVQAYDREDHQLERFRRENRGILDAELASARINGLFTPLVSLIELCGALGVIALGTWAVSQGDLTLGGLLVFLTYLTQLFRPLRDLGDLGATIFAASAGAERVIELLEERPSVVDPPDPVELGRVRGALEFDRVGFTYPGAERPALSEASLRVEPGETVALVGESGAGKSTLAKLVLRFFDPEAGAVMLDGTDLRAARLRSLRANVAVLLQETLILDGTVRENIAFGREGASEVEIAAAAHAAGADEFIAAMPDGYETVVGQRGRRLSGGQRQRIAIARALIRDAPVLVLDEPTTGLDARAAERLRGPLRELIGRRTTLVISHNLTTARDADRICVLEAGRIAELGTHTELLALGGAYARLWDRSSRGRTEPPRDAPGLIEVMA